MLRKKMDRGHAWILDGYGCLFELVAGGNYAGCRVA